MRSSDLCGAARSRDGILPSAADSHLSRLSIKRVLSRPLLPERGALCWNGIFGVRVLQRIESSPIREESERFVKYLHDRGHPQTTIQSYVQVVEHFGTWLRTLNRKRRIVNRHTVDEFLATHLPACCCPAPAPKHLNSTRAALRHLLRAVSQGSATDRLGSDSRLTDQLIEEYVWHLETNCGLAAATRKCRSRYACEFLQGRFPKGS